MTLSCIVSSPFNTSGQVDGVTVVAPTLEDWQLTAEPMALDSMEGLDRARMDALQEGMLAEEAEVQVALVWVLFA